MTKTETMTIDLTPTWSGILPMLLAVIENGTPQGVAEATAELARMAELADKYVAAQKALQEVAHG